MPELPPNLPVQLWNLRGGCYLLNFQPSGNSIIKYGGTLRIECHSGGRTASGDLYERFTSSNPVPEQGPDPTAGIPIFARDRYRHYLRVTQILEGLSSENNFTLGFELYFFASPNTGVFEAGSPATAQMTRQAAPAGYPSNSDYWEGDVKSGADTVIGRLTMGWVSEYLRRATIEIDRVSASEEPLDNGAGVNWRTIFAQVGWDVNHEVSNTDIKEPSGESWSNTELHKAMLKWRDGPGLDVEWRYYLLAVQKLDIGDQSFMFDVFGDDINEIPREGGTIASHWKFPNDDLWGQVKGKRLGEERALYFRNAVHEIGHAMGLNHNKSDNGIMNTNKIIAAGADIANPFPKNVLWSFAPDDQKRLRHYPDILVRPGGIASDPP